MKSRQPVQPVLIVIDQFYNHKQKCVEFLQDTAELTQLLSRPTQSESGCLSWLMDSWAI